MFRQAVAHIETENCYITTRGKYLTFIHKGNMIKGISGTMFKIVCKLRRYILLFAISIIFLQLFCINDIGNRDGRIPAYSGMVRIFSSGKSAVLGSMDTIANADERPTVVARFSYDFWIDTIEVTVGMYQELMGRLPAEYDSFLVKRLLDPIRQVTWYDAVLFCNARSRHEGLDSTYSYSSIECSPAGRVYVLNNLKFNNAANGYRLPTEAEWEYAARAGEAHSYPWGDSASSDSAKNYAWFTDNADNSVHTVAQLQRNRFGLYDMLGNVIEWVHDAKGSFPSGSVTNYLGALVSNEDERPIKGGGYVHSIDKIRYSNRSDEYKTTSSTASKYHGFRCAAGIIHDGCYSGGSGIIKKANPVTLVVNNLEPVVGALRSKITFINKGESNRTLCYVDYSESNPRVYQFTDIADVQLPTISPDGNWVAFCTAGEGISGKSSVFVRRLSPDGHGLLKLDDEPAFIPRWWVDPVSNDTFILYTNSACLNTSSSWSLTATKMQKFSSGKYVGSPVTVEMQGSFHDGLSVDGRYIASGYDRLIMKDRTSGEIHTLFFGPSNGKPVGDTSQVCNVSIGPDTTCGDRVLFLDFGSPKKSTLTNDTYSVHQYIFMSDYSGKQLHWYRCPRGAAAWDNPEWSNRAPFAIANVENNQSEHNAIYVINLVDSVYTKIIEGTELLNPYIWISNIIKAPIGLSIDSLGRYAEPLSNSAQSTLSWKLPLFWKYRSMTEVYLVGSSRILDGIYPQDFTKYVCLNLGASGSDLQTSFQLIRNYIMNHGEHARLIAVELMIDWMDLKDGTQSWADGISKSRGFVYDKNHSFWSNGLPLGYAELVQLASNTTPSTPDSLLGFVPFAQPKGWGGQNPPVRATTWTADTITCKENLAQLDSLGRELAERGIHLLLITMPQSPYYRKINYFGRYGATLQASSDIITSLRKIEQENTFFHLYDANLNGLHDYKDVDAADCNHLSVTGAHKFTKRLDSLINVILK
jgi:uncharacterized protein (TIGR02171 family)